MLNLVRLWIPFTSNGILFSDITYNRRRATTYVNWPIPYWNIVQINGIYMFWKAHTKYNKIPKIWKVLKIYILINHDFTELRILRFWRNFTPNCSVSHHVWSHSTQSYHNQPKQFQNSFAVWIPWIILSEIFPKSFWDLRKKYLTTFSQTSNTVLSKRCGIVK